MREPGEVGADLGAEELHAEDVRLLPLDIDLAHIDDALEAKAGAGGGGRDAVLAGAGLGDDPVLPMRRASRIWPMTLLIL